MWGRKKRKEEKGKRRGEKKPVSRENERSVGIPEVEYAEEGRENTLWGKGEKWMVG